MTELGESLHRVGLQDHILTAKVRQGALDYEALLEFIPGALPAPDGIPKSQHQAKVLLLS